MSNVLVFDEFHNAMRYRDTVLRHILHAIRSGLLDAPVLLWKIDRLPEPRVFMMNALVSGIADVIGNGPVTQERVIDIAKSLLPTAWMCPEEAVWQGLIPNGYVLEEAFIGTGRRTSSGLKFLRHIGLDAIIPVPAFWFNCQTEQWEPVNDVVVNILMGNKVSEEGDLFFDAQCLKRLYSPRMEMIRKAAEEDWIPHPLADEVGDMNANKGHKSGEDDPAIPSEFFNYTPKDDYVLVVRAKSRLQKVMAGLNRLCPDAADRILATVDAAVLDRNSGIMASLCNDDASDMDQAYPEMCPKIPGLSARRAAALFSMVDDYRDFMNNDFLLFLGASGRFRLWIAYLALIESGQAMQVIRPVSAYAEKIDWTLVIVTVASYGRNGNDMTFPSRFAALYAEIEEAVIHMRNAVLAFQNKTDPLNGPPVLMIEELFNIGRKTNMKAV